MTWDTDWPPVAAATLAAAEASGAGLVIIGNLYGYGQVEAPMREGDPMRPAGHKGDLRADMWTEALARHEAGRLRVTEVRSSDYFGPGTTARTSYLNDVVIDALLAGRTPFVPAGRADAAHSWTYVPDVGASRRPGGDRRPGLGSRLARADAPPARTFDEAAARHRAAGRRQAPSGTRAAPAARHRGRAGRPLHARAARDPAPVRAAVRARLGPDAAHLRLGADAVGRRADGDHRRPTGTKTVSGTAA